ncbi:MAG: Ig-like domain-containing protein, partial [Longimicrobiales bacterium]
MRNVFRARLLVIGLIVATGWACTETLVGIVELAVVEIEPRTATVYIDGEVSLRALLKDDRGNTLSGRPVSWTSENPQVATVNDQGVVHGVTAGEADIVASSEAIRSTARITVLLRPAIHMEPDSAVFTMIRGAVPAATTIDITNTGGGTLSGITVATEYGDGAAGWLESSLSAATAPATLTVTPVVGDLTPGTYRASLRISAADASNTPATLGIRFELLPAVPAHIAIAGGNDQSAAAGTAVSLPIGVRVTDASDGAIENVAVTFAVASGGGSLASAGPVLTNADGIAMAPVWTLGTVAGPNTLRATAEGLAADSVIITATAVPGTASQ